MKVKKIEISHKSIIFTICFLLALAVFWQIRSLLIMIFISFVLMQAFNPAVIRFQKLKIPRIISIILVYAIVIAFVSFVISGIVPILIDQTTALISSLPDFLKNLSFLNQYNIDWSSQLKILENVPGGIAKTALSIVSNVFSAVIVLVITFYLLLEKKNFPKYGDSFFGDKGKIKFLSIVDNLETRLGSWVSAELLLMTIIGLVSFIGYSLLGLKYAVPLAIFAGLLEAIPTIGPTIATIVAGLIALTISPLTALFVVVFGILVQQLENTFIVPKLMNKTVGLNPLVTIVLIAAGGQLAGFGGAVLAIPFYLTVESVLKGLSKDPKDIDKPDSV